MNIPHYIGFDVHKKAVNKCVKIADGQTVEEGKPPEKRGGKGRGKGNSLRACRR